MSKKSKNRPTGLPPTPESLVVGVYDNHTHLDPVVATAYSDPDAEAPLDYREHLDRASAVGIRGVVQVGTDVASSRWSAETAAIEPRMLAAVAIHPNEAPVLDASGHLDDALGEIAELASWPRTRALGETGLDFFRTGEDGREAQFRSFEAHIELAKQNDKALQIHDRDAHAEVAETLRRVGAPERTVLHCFSGDVDFARLCAENGWFMSFAGNVTFKNAPKLREALAVVPRSLLLVETDAPFLTPMPHRGRPNAPYLIPHTVRAMAEVLESDVDHVCAQLASNTEAVYGRWDADPVAAPPVEPGPLA